MSIKKKLVAVAVASALILGGVGAAQTAQAAPISGGSITLTPSSGNVSDQYFVTGMTVSAGAPVGYRAASSTWIFQNGVNMGGFSSLRKPVTDNTTYGTYGLDGNAASLDRSISPSNPFLTNKQLTALNLNPLQTGNFELRYYYHALATSIDLVNEPYATITLNYNSATGAWGAPAAAATPTTTSLTASATGTSVTLSATVKSGNPSTTATAAAGTVSFFEGATQVGTTQTVLSGQASVSLTGVANGTHSYTAAFTPSDAVYSASTSAAASVSVGALVAPGDTDKVPVGVTFNIAAATNGGALQLTSHDSIVALGTATVSGTTFNASGTLNAVVDDSRQAGSPDWNLTGVMADFTAPAVGTAPARTLSAKYLGWTPAVAAGSTGSAGAVVLPAPGSVAGLKTSSQLSYGSTSAADPQVTTTTVTALLQLKAPKNTAAGSYAGVLTLTLI